MPSNEYDLAVVGGGILGLATALSLTQRQPRLRITVLEKEKELAFHQTGHNSGVIHSGIYYRPGSLKAALCVRGAQSLVGFCRQNGIPIRRCGKVILAVTREELPRLQELHRRGTANGVPELQLIGPERLRELEPRAAGVQGLHVPGVWVVDYREVARAYAARIGQAGGTLRSGVRLRGIRPGPSSLQLLTTQGDLSARFLINCAGLHADRLARRAGARIPLQIVPFRGEYLELIPEKRGWVRGLIYPVPDPRFPFLGVHLSVRIDGRVEAGPNAVLAFKREGYRKSDLNLADLAQMLAFPGFWRMGLRHWKTGLEEMARSFSKMLFARQVQRLVPSIQPEDLLPSGSGVRAQALGIDGSLLDDFHLVQEGRALHVCNAPSPAATASLAIGEHVAEAALRQLGS